MVRAEVEQALAVIDASFKVASKHQRHLIARAEKLAQDAELLRRDRNTDGVRFGWSRS